MTVSRMQPRQARQRMVTTVRRGGREWQAVERYNSVSATGAAGGNDAGENVRVQGGGGWHIPTDTHRSHMNNIQECLIVMSIYTIYHKDYNCYYKYTHVLYHNECPHIRTQTRQNLPVTIQGLFIHEGTLYGGRHNAASAAVIARLAYRWAASREQTVAPGGTYGRSIIGRNVNANMAAARAVRNPGSGITNNPNGT